MYPPVRLNSTSALADALGVSRQTIWRWERDGRIPPPHRLLDGAIGWTNDEAALLIEWARGGQRDASIFARIVAMRAGLVVTSPAPGEGNARDAASVAFSIRVIQELAKSSPLYTGDNMSPAAVEALTGEVCALLRRRPDRPALEARCDIVQASSAPGTSEAVMAARVIRDLGCDLL